MLIRNDVKHMPVEKEINHIVENLNLAIKKIGCSELLLYNARTIENVAFIEIFRNNNKKINAILDVVGRYIERDKANNIIFTQWEDCDCLLSDLLSTNQIAIINTDTIFTEKSCQNKINYNIEVFKDYTTDFIKEIIKFYKVETNFNDIPSKISKDNDELLKDYILNRRDIYDKYTKEQLINFQMQLPKKAVSHVSIYNSITTNYIKGINDDLEKLND